MDIFFKDSISPKIINRKHGFYFSKASKIAEKSSMTHQHGCVIVSDEGNILSCGYNKMEDFMCHKYSIHAEIDAICKVKKNKSILQQSTMYIVRISKRGIALKYSKPCSDCQKMIEKYGIKRVYYSTSYEFDKIQIK
jgi:deoxycytidylate deaminase